jgi:hypothetical protein
VSAGAGLQTGAGSWQPWCAAPRPPPSEGRCLCRLSRREAADDVARIAIAKQPPVVSIRLHCSEPTAGAAVAMPSTCFERPRRCGGAALRLVKGPRLPAQSSRLSAQLPYCSWPPWHLRCGQTRRLSAPGRPRTCLTTKRVRRKHQVPQRELIDRSLLVPVPLGRIQAQRDGSARQSCRGFSAIVPAQGGRAARWLKPA